MIHLPSWAYFYTVERKWGKNQTRFSQKCSNDSCLFSTST